MCLPGHFPISPLRSQRAAPRGLSGPLQQHPGAQRPRGPQRCSCCLSRALLFPARSTGGMVSLGASGEMAVNRGFGQGALKGHARGTGHKGQQPHVEVWTQGKSSLLGRWCRATAAPPREQEAAPCLCLLMAGSHGQDTTCVCTLVAHSFVALQASLSSAQDPAVSTGCSMGRRPTGGAPTQPQHPPAPADK